MGVSISGQTLEFVNSALFGVVLAVFYDVLRVVRVFSRGGKIATALFDVFYWLCALCALFGFILTVSEGRMRWYVLLGVFCGGFLYMSTISVLVLKTLRISVSAMIRIIMVSVKPLYYTARHALKAGRVVKCKISKAYRRKAVLRAKKRRERKLRKAVGITEDKGRLRHGGKKKKKKSRNYP